MSSTLPEMLLRQIVVTCAPRRVILFGSHARGEAGPDSDLDLLVVLDDDASAEAQGGHASGVDIIPCRDRVRQDRARAPGSLAATALREGVTVHERS